MKILQNVKVKRIDDAKSEELTSLLEEIESANEKTLKKLRAQILIQLLLKSFTKEELKKLYGHVEKLIREGK